MLSFQKRVHALFRSASDISSHEEALNKLLTEFMDGGGQDGFNQRPINDPISPSRAQTDHQDPPGKFPISVWSSFFFQRRINIRQIDH